VDNLARLAIVKETLKIAKESYDKYEREKKLPHEGIGLCPLEISGKMEFFNSTEVNQEYCKVIMDGMHALLDKNKMAMAGNIVDNKIAEKHGLEVELDQLVEEMAELTQARSKVRRYGLQGKYLENLVEEINDVKVVLLRVKHLLNLQPTVLEEFENGIDHAMEIFAKQKNARELKRIEEMERAKHE